MRTGNQEGFRILVVEDNQLNFELVNDLLTLHGFTVLHATTGEEGLRLAREAMPDLVLMDWSLPGMDGLCATRNLKADPATKGLPVVALTAHAMQGDEGVVRQSGCDGYLTKPIDTRTFLKAITRFLKANRPEFPVLQTYEPSSETYAN